MVDQAGHFLSIIPTLWPTYRKLMTAITQLSTSIDTRERTIYLTYPVELPIKSPISCLGVYAKMSFFEFLSVIFEFFH